MGAVQDRLKQLGMDARQHPSGLTPTEQLRASNGQAGYTGAALPNTPEISLTSELEKLEAAEAAAGAGQPQQFGSMESAVGSPSVQFDRESPLEATNPDPIKALEAEGETIGTKDMVPNNFSEAQQVDYNAKIDKISSLKGEIDKINNSYGLAGGYQEYNKGDTAAIEKEIAALEKDSHDMKYNKNYDFIADKKKNTISFPTEGKVPEVSAGLYSKYMEGKGGNFEAEEAPTEVVPKITGDEKFDESNYWESKSYDTPFKFPGAVKYMKEMKVDKMDKGKAMVLAFEGTKGDTTGVADTEAYGMKSDLYNRLKKSNPGFSDEQLFDAAYVEKRDAVRKMFNSGDDVKIKYDSLPKSAKNVLNLAMYRGDFKTKHEWVNHLRKGRYAEAAKEIIDNGDARDSKKKKQPGIAKRFYTYYRLLLAAQAEKFSEPN